MKLVTVVETRIPLSRRPGLNTEQPTPKTASEVTPNESLMRRFIGALQMVRAQARIHMGSYTHTQTNKQMEFSHRKHMGFFQATCTKFPRSFIRLINLSRSAPDLPDPWRNTRKAQRDRPETVGTSA